MRIWPLAHAFLDDDLLPESAGVHHHRKTQEEGASTPSFYVAIFAHELSLGSTPIAESQGGLSQLCVEVIGRYLNPNSLIPDNRLFSFVSPPSARSSTYQEAVWPEEAILCHCDQSCDGEEDGKRPD